MRRLTLLLMFLSLPIAFSAVRPIGPIELFGEIFNAIVSSAGGEGPSFYFMILLGIIAIILFAAVYNRGYKLFESMFKDAKLAKLTAFLLAVAIDIMTFTNTHILLGILTIASTPISIYIIIIIIFGLVSLFWVPWDSVKFGIALVGIFILWFAYSYVYIDPAAVNQIAGTNLPEDRQMTPFEALEELTPGLGAAFNAIFIMAFFGVAAAFLFTFGKEKKKD